MDTLVCRRQHLTADSHRRQLFRLLFQTVMTLALTAAIGVKVCTARPVQEAANPSVTVANNYHIVVGRFTKPQHLLIRAKWDELGPQLQDNILEKLIDKSVPVVDRGVLDQVKDELARAGDTVNADTSIAIGKHTGGTHLLVGRVTFEIKADVFVYRYIMTLTARLISLDSGRPVRTFVAKGEKKGNVVVTGDSEVDHFIESTMNMASDDLAKKIAANPPPIEAHPPAVGGGGLTAVGTSGSHVFETDGQAPVESGDSQGARTAARVAALHDAVMRWGRLFTRSDSQQALEQIIGNETARYAVMEGDPISEEVKGGTCRSTIHVRVFLTSAPENKLALLTRLRDRGLLSAPKVMVVVHESHVQKPIPDPALETEIARQLIDAGFEVVDSARTREIRDLDWVQASAKGTVNQAELARMKADYGADFFVTGHGTSERGEATGPPIRCSARCDIKAFRTDNAQMLFSDAISSVQATGISETIAAMSALQSAGKVLGPRVINGLFTRGFGRQASGGSDGPALVTGTTIAIKLSGWKSAAEMGAFLKALPKAKGIIKVIEYQYDAQVLTLKALVKPDAAAELGFSLSEDAAIQRFHLNITTLRGTTIEGAVKL